MRTKLHVRFSKLHIATLVCIGSTIYDKSSLHNWFRIRNQIFLLSFVVWYMINFSTIIHKDIFPKDDWGYMLVFLTFEGWNKQLKNMLYESNYHDPHLEDNSSRMPEAFADPKLNIIFQLQILLLKLKSLKDRVYCTHEAW